MVVKYFAKNDIGQHALVSVKARMCLLAQQVASIRQDLIQVKTESSCYPLYFPSSPSVKHSTVLLFHSCPFERFMSHRLSAGYLPQFFFSTAPPQAMRAFITAAGRNNELKLISNTNVGFSAG